MYSVAACLLISVTLTVGAPERQRVQRQTGTCSVRDPDINGFPARNYIAGQAYVLICQCSGLGVVQDSVTVFNWYKNGGKLSESGENITFSSLRLSDAAEYTCNATAGNMIHESSGDSYTITVQIPAPSYVIMRSDKINPIRPIGANVTLTCIVGLQSLVADSEIQLTVDILLSGPNGRALGATVLPMSKSSYISTAVIYSFDRHDSGAYICAATLASASPFLTESSTLIEELTLISGVYLLQNGVGIQNNTCISTHNNGSSSPHQLACVSDRVPCCDGSPQHGRWHDEHGLPVDSNIFHINRTDEGHINLTVFRVPDEIVGYGGKICCTVDDFTGVFHTACINLVPSIVVTVTDNGSSPIAGSDYSLTCDVSGAEVESFIWRKDGVAMHNIGSILKFSPLNFSDTGEYSCHVSIDEACELSGKKTVQVQVTPPSSVKITSYPPTPIQPIGASVTINCTVELSWPIYDTLMIIRLTHPEGSTLASSSVSAGSTVHTLITEVASFQRNDSGTYNCTATISSRSTSGVANIFIGAACMALLSKA